MTLKKSVFKAPEEDNFHPKHNKEQNALVFAGGVLCATSVQLKQWGQERLSLLYPHRVLSKHHKEYLTRSIY